jgi:hypothetical protein
VLFLHLFDGTNSPAEIGNFCKLLLDCFQPLVPLAVSYLSLRFISAAPSILGVQLLQLGDFGAESANLFPKHCEVIHSYQHSIWQIEYRSPIGSQVITSVLCAKELSFPQPCRVPKSRSAGIRSTLSNGFN